MRPKEPEKGIISIGEERSVSKMGGGEISFCRIYAEKSRKREVAGIRA
jgi:hypothetical protein